MDVLTLGAWEIIGTPIEGFAQSVRRQPGVASQRDCSSLVRHPVGCRTRLGARLCSVVLLERTCPACGEVFLVAHRTDTEFCPSAVCKTTRQRDRARKQRQKAR